MTLASILQKLPDLKSSADFDAAITDLEHEHPAALAAVAELESRREKALFDGDGLEALEADIAAATRTAETLGIALAGASTRRDDAAEAERQAALEVRGAALKRLHDKITGHLIDFNDLAAKLAAVADKITTKRDEMAEHARDLVAAERPDLVPTNQITALAHQLGRLVADPVKGLKIPEYWPVRPDGPALAKLRR